MSHNLPITKTLEPHGCETSLDRQTHWVSTFNTRCLLIQLHCSRHAFIKATTRTGCIPAKRGFNRSRCNCDHHIFTIRLEMWRNLYLLWCGNLANQPTHNFCIANTETVDPAALRIFSFELHVIKLFKYQTTDWFSDGLCM